MLYLSKTKRSTNAGSATGSQLLSNRLDEWKDSDDGDDDGGNISQLGGSSNSSDGKEKGSDNTGTNGSEKTGNNKGGDTAKKKGAGLKLRIKTDPKDGFAYLVLTFDSVHIVMISIITHT